MTVNTIVHCRAIVQMHETAVFLLQNTAVFKNTQKEEDYIQHFNRQTNVLN
jgi:hypothetical protein